MIRSIKVRLKPTSDQEVLFWKSSGTHRFIYNWTLSRQIESYKSNKKFISDSILRKEITQLKKTEEFSWLGEVSAQIPSQSIKDCCEGIKKFFKRKDSNTQYKKSSLKHKEKDSNYKLSLIDLKGFPSYKSRKTSRPSFYNNPVALEVKPNSVLIEKIGWVVLSEKNRIPLSSKDFHSYMNPRITYDNKYWYLSVGIEMTDTKVELSNESLGLDLGVKELVVCSNKMRFKNINKSKRVKKIEKRLRRLQRKVSRKYQNNKKGESFVKTSNTLKIEKKISLISRRLRNIRENHIHQITSTLVKTKPGRVVMENLNVKGMMKNRHLSDSIGKCNFYKIKDIMKYKCEKYGIVFVEVPRFFPSSKKCSQCGNIKKDLNLSERTYHCDKCGLEIDRDFNASINLSEYEEVIVSQ